MTSEEFNKLAVGHRVIVNELAYFKDTRGRCGSIQAKGSFSADVKFDEPIISRNGLSLTYIEWFAQYEIELLDRPKVIPLPLPG
jgi:hypothetical protein